MRGEASTEQEPYAIDLAGEQRQIRRNAAVAALLCGAVLVGACYALTHFFLPPPSLAERIAFALHGDVFMLMWPIICAQLVSSGRYRSVADNRGAAFSPPSPRIAIDVAFL